MKPWDLDRLSTDEVAYRLEWIKAHPEFPKEGD